MSNTNYRQGVKRDGDEYRWGLLKDNKCSPGQGNKCVNDISEFGSVNPDCKFNVSKFVSDNNFSYQPEVNQCIQNLNKQILTDNKDILYIDDPTMPEGSQHCTVRDIYKKIVNHCTSDGVYHDDSNFKLYLSFQKNIEKDAYKNPFIKLELIDENKNIINLREKMDIDDINNRLSYTGDIRNNYVLNFYLDNIFDNNERNNLVSSFFNELQNINSLEELKNTQNPNNKWEIQDNIIARKQIENTTWEIQKNRRGKYNLVGTAISKNETNDLEGCTPEIRSRYFNTKFANKVGEKYLQTSDITCDTNNCNISKDLQSELNNNKKRFYRNFYNDMQSNDKILNCHEIDKIKNYCKNVGHDKDTDDQLKKLYDKFVKGDYENQELPSDIKYKDVMCALAYSNISNKRSDIEEKISDWWLKNIYNEGFQRNIYHISLLIVIILKFNILKKFPLLSSSGNQYILPIICIFLTIGFYFLFIYTTDNQDKYLTTSFQEKNNDNSEQNPNTQTYINLFGKYVYYIIGLAIICGYGIFIKNNYLGLRVTEPSIFIHYFIFVLTFISLFILPNMNLFKYTLGIVGIILLIYTNFMSISKNIYFKFSSVILIIFMFISYISANQSNSFQPLYFYTIIYFIIITIIISQKNTPEKNLLPRLLINNDNISKIIKILYVIFAVSDSYVSILSPQLSLLITILFRIIVGYWFEPINCIFASLSEYNMSYNGEISNANILSRFFYFQK